MDGISYVNGVLSRFEVQGCVSYAHAGIQIGAIEVHDATTWHLQSLNMRDKRTHHVDDNVANNHRWLQTTMLPITDSVDFLATGLVAKDVSPPVKYPYHPIKCPYIPTVYNILFSSFETMCAHTIPYEMPMSTLKISQVADILALGVGRQDTYFPTPGYFSGVVCSRFVCRFCAARRICQVYGIVRVVNVCFRFRGQPFNRYACHPFSPCSFRDVSAVDHALVRALT